MMVAAGPDTSADTGPGSGPDTSPLEDIDKVVHEPARLMILAQLYVVEEADFRFLQNRTGLTAGNLSFHTTKLEGAGYLEIEKLFRDKTPSTFLRLTAEGRAAFEEYRERLSRVFDTLP
jgi:DNA-binding MarR family transcriptional regulator